MFDDAKRLVDLTWMQVQSVSHFQACRVHEMEKQQGKRAIVSPYLVCEEYIQSRPNLLRLTLPASNVKTIKEEYFLPHFIMHG